MYVEKLSEKIRDKKAKIGIIGLGYVGLPLAVEFAKYGFEVTGFDINKEKVMQLNSGSSYIIDIPTSELEEVVQNGHLKATTEFEQLSGMNAICICVPTPLTKSQEPDMSYITNSVSKIKQYMKKGTLIILESTTYPGTTEELIQEELENIGYQVGVDFFLCFSPERIDPGNTVFQTKNTIKVIGGTTKNCSNLGEMLYEKVIKELHVVSSTKVAEMSKLLENTFRSINIAFINEMALLSESLELNIWEVIEASATKPFGFMKFCPGPGIGGHCIPLDPMYLSWKAKGVNFYSHFIELAQETNKKMPEHISRKASEALNFNSKSIRNSKILLLGMAYKPNIDDIRESPALDIYELLKKEGANLDYFDPMVKSFKNENGDVIEGLKTLGNQIEQFDLVIILTNHQLFDMEEIFMKSQLILDTRNAMNGKEHQKLFRIGDGSKKIALGNPGF
ncbi:UDP-N-acetyl-D-glucosamine 6-dehydrogenase [Carnobacterium maltaromaticum]|uniref:nucleotide sugar dehydrogenase n=1 Tax=Carnobacterium maltaromaticum TaxID=2751 RepID=UPI00191BA1F0|nr:nucleotide sugar dehydrogenase [Carnobacterium maltaromaticum]CAD5902614.1 UDP-N-acetyl-D-glucosamine 6-dehydrogenase [Carnobacterium maltaromaticum]